MKMLQLPGAFFALACLVLTSFAADPKPATPQKTPADAAFDQTVALLDNRDAKQNQARLDAVTKAGIGFLVTHGDHAKAGTVIDKMMRWTSVLTDKKREMRSSYYAQVQRELAAPLSDVKLGEDSRAALLALDTAMSEGLFRENPGQETLVRWLEKLDAQMRAKSTRDLLKDRAAAFYDVLATTNAAAAAKFLSSLAENADRNAANWAKLEAKFTKVRQAPFELSFNAIDGTAVDVVTLRGKVVCLFFWSAGTKDLADKVEVLRKSVVAAGSKRIAVISVCVDKEADREKAAATMKDAYIKWPTHFDGQGLEGELCKKLNVSPWSLPAILVLDQNGVMTRPPAGRFAFDQWNIDREIKRLMEPPKKPQG